MNILSEALNPVAGEPPGHELNSQPEEPTVVGGASDEPVPDLFSAGAESTTYPINGE